jgi:hypothetical protein
MGLNPAPGEPNLAENKFVCENWGLEVLFLKKPANTGNNLSGPPKFKKKKKPMG